VATAVAVPVLVALLVLVNVLGNGGEGDDGADRAENAPPAEVEGSTPQQRADLPVLPLEVPPVTPEADAACPALMAELPLELTGEPSRRVQSDSPFGYAWGEPPIVLICGVPRPAGLQPDSPLFQLNGVSWYVDTTDPETTVWTTVDRPVHVEVRLPATVDSAPVTALSTHIAATLPYQEP
jgi:hypothetical protein